MLEPISLSTLSTVIVLLRDSVVEKYFVIKYVYNTEYLYRNTEFNINLSELDECLHRVDQLSIKMWSSW